MKEIILAPIPETPSDYDAIMKKILELFRTEIYLPLMKELNEKPKALKNSTDDLLEAIASGRITYYRGQFKGAFNSMLSRELRGIGAEWDRTQGSWKIPQSKLPIEIKNAILANISRLDRILKKIDDKLARMLPANIAEKLQVEKLFDKTLWKVNGTLQKQIKSITVAPQLSDKAREGLAKSYSENLKLYVQKFSEEEILDLRQKIQKSAFAGNRYESMIATIKKSYGVSENKAKFLARQETSLLMSKFKEERYKDAGSQEYIWRCVHNAKDKSPNQHTPHNVRYYHGILDGKKFRWDDPPIVNEKGDRKNPGQDYNCRCTARPILKF